MKVIRYAAFALIPLLCIVAKHPAALTAPSDLKDAVGDDSLAALRDGMNRVKTTPQRGPGAAPVSPASAPDADPAAAAPAGLSVDPASADRIFQNVMENGESGDAFDGPGYFLFRRESPVETITVNAVAREGAEALYQDKSRSHFRGLVVVHTFRTPGCPGDEEKDGRLYTDSWIYDMDLGGRVYESGRHAFCTSGPGHDAKRVKSSKAPAIDGDGPSTPGLREDFAKIAPRLPGLEKKGSPYWLEGAK